MTLCAFGWLCCLCILTTTYILHGFPTPHTPTPHGSVRTRFSVVRWTLLRTLRLFNLPGWLGSHFLTLCRPHTPPHALYATVGYSLTVERARGTRTVLVGWTGHSHHPPHVYGVTPTGCAVSHITPRRAAPRFTTPRTRLHTRRWLRCTTLHALFAGWFVWLLPARHRHLPRYWFGDSIILSLTLVAGTTHSYATTYFAISFNCPVLYALHYSCDYTFVRIYITLFSPCP